MPLYRLLIGILIPLAISFSAIADTALSHTNLIVSFASVETGKTFLSTRDEHIAAMSPFDRMSRVKTNVDVSENELRQYLASCVRAWAPDETNKVAGMIASINRELANWTLPFPSPVVFIKSSGGDEANADYTRQNTVVIPQHELASDNLESIITHELFHVLSRQNPSLRTNLYAIIGFKRINEIKLPPELAACKITNPDGVQNGWMITVTNQSRTLQVVPLLYSTSPQFDPKVARNFFDSLVFRLMAVEEKSGVWVPKLKDGQPELLNPYEADGFFDQIGSNTAYLIHPDEILAENFVALVEGKVNLASPRVVKEMDRVFREGAAKK